MPSSHTRHYNYSPSPTPPPSTSPAAYIAVCVGVIAGRHCRNLAAAAVWRAAPRWAPFSVQRTVRLGSFSQPYNSIAPTKAITSPGAFLRGPGSGAGVRGTGVTRQKSDRHGTVLRPHKSNTGEEEEDKKTWKVWFLHVGNRGQTANGEKVCAKFPTIRQERKINL